MSQASEKFCPARAFYMADKPLLLTYNTIHDRLFYKQNNCNKISNQTPLHRYFPICLGAILRDVRRRLNEDAHD